MDLRQFEYVIAVVDEGTFTRAAAAAHVAQPSLSQGIRALERELGVELFHRVGRRAVLSAAGEVFVGPARQALRDAAVARDAVQAVRGLTAGRLDIATLPTLAVEPLAAWVGEFRRSYPGVQIGVVEPEDALSVHERVRDGRSEVGLAELPAPPDLESVSLGDQELVAIAPADADLPGSGPVAVADLARFPLVSTPPGTSTRELVEAAFAVAGVKGVVAVETASREALVPLVAAGAGITFVPVPRSGEAEERGLRVVRPEPPIRRHIGLVHRRGVLSPAAAAFINLMRDRP